LPRVIYGSRKRTVNIKVEVEKTLGSELETLLETQTVGTYNIIYGSRERTVNIKVEVEMTLGSELETLLET